jgi:hypothetical protein
VIRRLRERHRRMIPVIALLAAIALTVAIVGRRLPGDGTIPPALEPHREPR